MNIMKLNTIPLSAQKSRSDNIKKLKSQDFDVLIIGGGINGCCIYHHAKQAGMKVALIEAKDFASQTSQSSGMMIWGGLLYLQNFDVKTVYNFSRSRDKLIDWFPGLIEPKTFHFIRSKNSKWRQIMDYLGMHLYWMFSHFKRKKPYFSDKWNNQKCISFEESVLKTSDAKFAISWLNLLPNNENVCMNYVKVSGGHYNAKNKMWQIVCLGEFEQEQIQVNAKCVINAAGTSVDELNQRFDIQTPYKHVFSKGVYINVKNKSKDNKSYIFEMGSNNDVLTYMPWGNVALWGSTETIIENKHDGDHVTQAEIDFLIEKGEELTNGLVCRDDVISTRVGIRPLAVLRNKKTEGLYGLAISRKHKITLCKERPWACVYGGKISGCDIVAKQTIQTIKKGIKIKTVSNHQGVNGTNKPIGWFTFPGIKNKMHGIQWCVDNEYCCTIEDYLRRRTNIAQWIPNNSLGEHYENMHLIQNLCKEMVQDENQAIKHFNHFFHTNTPEVNSI